jgi:hypothetical protein
MVFGAPAPAAYEAISESERERRCAITTDQCIIDDSSFFVLGRLQIPVIDVTEPFTWLCWVSLSELDFNRASALWHAEGRESEPPYSVELATGLPYEQSTLGLSAKLVTQPLGQRPLVELEQTTHPLGLQQSKGIAIQLVQRLAEQLLH